MQLRDVYYGIFFFLFLGELEEISQPKKQGSLPAMAMCWI